MLVAIHTPIHMHSSPQKADLSKNVNILLEYICKTIRGLSEHCVLTSLLLFLFILCPPPQNSHHWTSLIDGDTNSECLLSEGRGVGRPHNANKAGWRHELKEVGSFLRTACYTIWPVNTDHVNLPEKVSSETKMIASESGTEAETEHAEISPVWPDTGRTLPEAGCKRHWSTAEPRQMLCRSNNCLDCSLSLCYCFGFCQLERSTRR